MFISRATLIVGVVYALGCYIGYKVLKAKADYDFNNLFGKEIYTVSTKESSNEGIPLVHVKIEKVD